MKKFRIRFRTFLLLLLTCAAAAEEPKILDHDALNSEAAVRRAVAEEFPGLDFGFYHWTGTWIIGALEDFDRERVLLLLPGEGIGEAEFSCNGEALAQPPGVPVSLRIAGALHTPEGIVNQPENASDTKIGYWMHLRATDRMRIAVKLTWPAKGSFTATYDPDHQWQTSCTFEVAEQDRKEPADAYEITRGSLLRQVREILRAEDESVVRLKSRADITIKMWSDEAEADLEPLIMTLSDKLQLGTGDWQKEHTPQELKLALARYRAAATAAGIIPQVRMHLADDADDRFFRAALNALTDEDFRVVYLAHDKEKPPGERR